MILIWVICQKKKMGGQKFIIKTIISSFINQQQKAVKSHIYSKSKNHHVCVQQDTLLLPCPLLVTGEECWLPQTSLRVGRVAHGEELLPLSCHARVAVGCHW